MRTGLLGNTGITVHEREVARIGGAVQEAFSSLSSSTAPSTGPPLIRRGFSGYINQSYESIGTFTLSLSLSLSLPQL